jgi:two-component system NtrC family sensor kinase
MIKKIFLAISSLLNYFSNNLSITKKIAYGYSLSIGIAILGTISGLIIADYYEQKFEHQLELASEQENILRKLENAAIKTRIHPQQLLTVLEDSIWLEFEKSKFLTNISQVEQELRKLEDFVKQNPNNLATEDENLQTFLNQYQTNTQQYTNLLKSLWQKIDPYKPISGKAQTYQNELIILMKGEEITRINVDFEILSEELGRILERAEVQKQTARSSFHRAHELGKEIVIGSMVLSGFLAVILAYHTSKAIASPLQTLTDIARKITAESNFNLRANVLSNDEVGTLAKSLNQLVQRVGDYTLELELARQTLEERVEERTIELQKTLQDLKETQTQLIQTEKMSSLGQMVAGIAHEINNPVNFIYGNVEFADNSIQDLLSLLDLYKQYYPEPQPIIQEKIQEIDLDYLCDDLSKLFSSIKMGAHRIREIVLSLRNFSRLDEADMKEVDIHEGIDNTLLLLNHRLKQGVEVLKNYGNLSCVECYPAQLNQVFMNIISNAVDAVLEDKTDKDSKQIVIDTYMVDDSYIKVSIKDNGPGIPPERIKKLFDPFFTTKPVGKGTGLGLSICYKIIEKHHGKIEVFSEVGTGTEFLISIPIKTVNA